MNTENAEKIAVTSKFLTVINKYGVHIIKPKIILEFSRVLSFIKFNFFIFRISQITIEIAINAITYNHFLAQISFASHFNIIERNAIQNSDHTKEFVALPTDL